MTAARDAYTAGRDLVINLGGQSEASSAEPAGRVIGELGEQDALALEVHQAFEASTSGQVPVLPVYLHRPRFDDRLRAVVAGAPQSSRMVVVVGESSTGKTRACWEAIRAELPDWRVWHPLTPERPAALAEAVRAGRVAARTVIWLNEAQFYLQPAGGEQVAAELQALLADPARGPVLVLGSMWPEFRRVLTVVPDDPAKPDPHRAARALLDRADYITAPSEFAEAQLSDLAATINADPRLRAAAEQAHGGRITQELAGASELLRRYEQGSPAARAVLWAAMDARRLGHSLFLPEPLLRDAAPGYLDDHDWDQVGGSPWFRAALDELTESHRRLPGPLVERHPRPGEPQPPHRLYRLADYLDQHARTERSLLCPPASFWAAVARYAHTVHDLAVLAGQAETRGRYRHAEHLYRAAVDAGSPDAIVRLGRQREEAGDRDDAERFYRQAADAGDDEALLDLIRLREEAGDREGAERLAQQAADIGKASALGFLAQLREQAGDRDDAERLYQQAADAGKPHGLLLLALQRELAGDPWDAERLTRQATDAGARDALLDLAQRREAGGDFQNAERFYQEAANAGNTNALVLLGLRREQAGDPREAERLYRQAAGAGNTDALVCLARRRERAGDLQDAERLTQEAIDAGNTNALVLLGLRREQAGDLQDAEQLFRQAADAGNTHALMGLARRREEAGDRQGAERLIKQIAAAGDTDELLHLAWEREARDDHAGAERLFRQSADAGNTDALMGLAQLRALAGDLEGAERLTQEAIDSGNTGALLHLAWQREARGDRASAERLFRQSADAGNSDALLDLSRLWEAAGEHRSAERLRRFGLTAAGDVEEPWT
ncbi:tetratricopeptide repeat protein [Actinomadura decatromicini]|uniref:tetratricopeptide repeat protein n=1 Tax=Actinomadura decatromicini TaxID=2604572 RepID=UPI001652D567|nr:tetratricopeptide repeat protein [Actinomadura decatromicini]